MSQQGVARKTQSTITFSNGTNTDEISQQQKRLRSDITETPQISINGERYESASASASTTTIVENASTDDQPEDIDIIRLDRLYDKRDRFTSHVSFLNECIGMKKIPDGLVINLEPTIGNHDEEFRTLWYNRLQDFSLTLMQDIVAFAEKTKTETTDRITTEKETLGPRKLNKDVMDALNNNSDERKRILNNVKRKKLQWLKFNRNNTTPQSETRAYGTRFRGARQNEFGQNDFNNNRNNNFLQNNNTHIDNYVRNSNSNQNNNTHNNNCAENSNYTQNSNYYQNNNRRSNNFAQNNNSKQNNNPVTSNNSERRTWSSVQNNKVTPTSVENQAEPP